jgi:hypothetical protein
MENQEYYEVYKAYYTHSDYADRYVMSALKGTGAYFEQEDDARIQGAKKGSVYMNVWMYVIREFEDAIDDCTQGCAKLACNADPVHAWDEGVAFYTGSLVGETSIANGGTEIGKLVYALAEKRCINFKTCGESGDSVEGGAYVNRELFKLFDEGQQLLYSGQCSSVRPIVDRIVELMTVPLIQGTLRYAYKVGVQGVTSTKDKAEGAVFAAAVLPLVHACSVDAANTIYSNMKIGATAPPDFPAVKALFEANYQCIGVTCADVGGYWEAGANGYYAGAGPCDNSLPWDDCTEADLRGDFNGVNGFTLGDAIYVAEVWAELRPAIACMGGDFNRVNGFTLGDAIFTAQA